jgi:glycerol transport system ATP-binding protein
MTTQTGRQFPAIGVLANLPDGAYIVGFRCDNVSLRPGVGAVPFPGIVAVAELSGSESFVHVDVGVGTWVCLVEGIHGEFAHGTSVDLHVDLKRAFVFGPDGKLVAAPALAASA